MNGYLDNSVNAQIDEYLLSLLPERDAVLQRMEQYALERKFPFIGPLVGQLLGILARAVRAKNVFEMGSGFGFSAVHFARALPPDGKVICTDGDPANAQAAQRFFTDANIDDRIKFRVGDAVKVLSEYDGPFDIILMDIDKEGYPAGFQAAWPKLKAGGLFVVDNMLWHGRIWTDDHSASTQGVRELTRLLHSTPNARTSILPIRDGVSVSLKTA